MLYPRGLLVIAIRTATTRPPAAERGAPGRERVMRLTVSLQVTVDGVAQANGGNDEELDPGFTRGGWALGVDDSQAADYILDTWRRPDAFLLGRKTYDLFARYWGARSDDGGFGEAISSKPKYVVSNSLTHATWEHSTVVSGDVAARLRALKADSDGELLLVGSVALARWLLENELVDELNLIQFPVIVGQGESFLPREGRDVPLHLTDSRVFPSGVVALTYGIGARPQY
jgi:dihydrofolate reductase